MNSNIENKRRRLGGRRKWLVTAPLFALMIAVAVLIKSAVFAWLWNMLVPDLFHGPEITYLQAIGLLVLAKLLVGFGGRGGFGPGGFGKFGGGRQAWMMKEVWSRLPDDERQKLRDEMRARWNR